jgi:hypothetical protein
MANGRGAALLTDKIRRKRVHVRRCMGGTFVAADADRVTGTPTAEEEHSHNIYK